MNHPDRPPMPLHDAGADFLREALGLASRINQHLQGGLRSLNVRRQNGLLIRCRVLDGSICAQLAPAD